MVVEQQKLLHVPVHLRFAGVDKKTREYVNYGKNLDVIMTIEDFADKVANQVSVEFKLPIDTKTNEIKKNKIVLKYASLSEGRKSEEFDLKGMTDEDYNYFETHEIDEDKTGIILTEKRGEIYAAIENLLEELKIEITKYNSYQGSKLYEDGYLKHLLSLFNK